MRNTSGGDYGMTEQFTAVRVKAGQRVCHDNGNSHA